jgi:lipoate---protein ligase
LQLLFALCFHNVFQLIHDTMRYLDRTFGTPQENLACDEALLDWCEEGFPDEILRFWEPRQDFVVLGYSNKTATEVNLNSCRSLDIPVLRRCSGGGAVLQGPGCLNYCLILKIGSGITEANKLVMEKHRDALHPVILPSFHSSISVQGHTDLTLDGLKFSGNSQRRRRHFLLFHGTFLLNADLALIERVLPMPTRRPVYRQDRAHREFLTNLNLTAPQLRAVLQKAWRADEPLTDIPLDKIQSLTATRYSSEDWNYKF